MNYSIEILKSELKTQKNILKMLRDSIHYSGDVNREEDTLEKVINLQETIEFLENINT